MTWIPDTFFTALLSGRISSLRDDTGAIFIDRDPHLFSVILNYLRTRDIDLKQIDIRVLRHEAEFFNISPLIKRLVLCEDLGHSSCGDVLFYGCLLPPNIPIHDGSSNQSGSESEPRSSTSSTSSQFSTCSTSNINQQQAKPGSMVRVPELNSSVASTGAQTSRHSRNSSWDRYSGNGSSRNAQVVKIMSIFSTVSFPQFLLLPNRVGKLVLDTPELLHLICDILAILRLISTIYVVMLLCLVITILRAVGRIHYEYK